MKIDNYTDANGYSANTFTFPHNPNAFDVQTDNFVDQQNFAYAFSYFGMTNPIKNKQSGIIKGHFDGASKLSNYRSLSAHFNSNKLKRLYFGSDKFMIVVPQGIKRTHLGGRTNIVDYVATFISPFGILFDDTQKSGDETGTGSDKTNEGNVTTPVEKIECTVTGGSSFTLADKDNNGFTGTANGSGSVDLIMYLVTMEDMGSDNYITSYIYVTTDGDATAIKTSTSGKSMLLRIEADEDLGTAMNSGSNNSGVSAITYFFRDGWSGD